MPVIKCKQSGTSLIEVLVTLFVMAVGLLGLASMQMISTKNINNSQFRSLATDYAYDMAERMRANRAGVEAGNYTNLSTSGATATTCNSCTISQIALLDQYEWSQAITQGVISGGLPSGSGAVSGSVATGRYDISLQWNEQGRDDSGGTLDNTTFTLSIQL